MSRLDHRRSSDQAIKPGHRRNPAGAAGAAERARKSADRRAPAAYRGAGEASGGRRADRFDADPERLIAALFAGESIGWDQLRERAALAASDGDLSRHSEERCPPLTSAQRVVYRIIERHPDGIVGTGIVEEAASQGHFIEQSTLTRHIIPRLKPHGVKNRRGVGYYIDRAT